MAGGRDNDSGRGRSGRGRGCGRGRGRQPPKEEGFKPFSGSGAVASSGAVQAHGQSADGEGGVFQARLPHTVGCPPV